MAPFTKSVSSKMDIPRHVGFDEQSRKLENAMNRLVEDLDRSHLRKLHADMHSCAAKCCHQKEDSLETVYRCVEGCRVPVDAAWNLVESELQGFHEKLTQCLDTCTSKSKWIAQATDLQMSRSTKELEECSNKCVETMMKAMPSLLDKMKSSISRTTKANASVSS